MAAVHPSQLDEWHRPAGAERVSAGRSGVAAGGAGERVVALLLAAGAGRRFGGAKQLAPLDGRPLLERPLRALAEARGLAETVVTLGARRERIRAAVDLHGARVVEVPEWEEGIAASLRAGVAAVAGSEAPRADAARADASRPDADASCPDALLVVLGDQAWLRARDVELLLAAARRAPDAAAVRAVHAGRPGHPVLLRRRLFGALARLRGDRGAGALLRAVEVVEVELGAAAVADVDRPAQLIGAAARAGGEASAGGRGEAGR